MPKPGLRASIVIPVYNPGPAIERCIASVLTQTLATDEYEVIFVDDGSTDGTPAGLDALAAADARVSVIHTPNSGWAGRPRNVGIDAARGAYVQFVDHDDELTPEALERLLALAEKNMSDIVLGKEASDFRPVAVGVFQRNRDRCTIADAPLILNLTPHKMFRTAFLREHGLRFPEGRRRLEDQLFVVQAYFAADTISILADHVCYRYRAREDGGNAADVLPDPAGYYANAHEVTDVVMANTTPGELRDRLLVRFLRTEALGRLTDARFTDCEPDYRTALFEAARSFARDITTPGAIAALETLQALRLRLLLDGDLDGMVRLAEHTTGILATARLVDASWRGSAMSLSLRCGLTGSDGTPLMLARDDDRWHVLPSMPAELRTATGGVPGDPARARVTMTVRDPATGAEWVLRASTSPCLPAPSEAHDPNAPVSEPGPEGRPPGNGAPQEPMAVELDVHATLLPRRIAAGRHLPDGCWELNARMFVGGLDHRSRVRLAGVFALPPDIRGAAPVVTWLSHTEDGVMTVETGRGPAAVARAAARCAPVLGPTDGRRLELFMPARVAHDVDRIAAELGIVDATGPVFQPAALVPVTGGLRAAATFRPVRGAAHTARLVLRVGGDPAAQVDLGVASVTARGHIRPDRAPLVSSVRLAAYRVRREALRTRRRAGSVVRRSVRRLRGHLRGA